MEQPRALRLLQNDAFVTPLNVFATHLNAPCSSILLAQEDLYSRIYLVVGKITGETVFFPVDRAECVSKFESESKEPITATTAGDVRNTGKVEVVTVSCNGHLQSLRFPHPTAQTATPIPTRVFSQQVNANVCAAECFDIDGDGLNEFLVVMTDRVVRSYRFDQMADCLVPQNKWEMPNQISGWALGLGSGGPDIGYGLPDTGLVHYGTVPGQGIPFAGLAQTPNASALNAGLSLPMRLGQENWALLSQACQSQYVRLDFGQSKNVRVVQSTVADRKYGTLLFIPPNPYAIRLMQSLVSKLVMVTSEKEVELHNPGGDFVCVTHARLHSGLHTIITVDPWGQLLVYAFTKDSQVVDPVARCNVLRDVDHMCAFPGPSNYSLFLSLVNIYNKVAIYLIDLAHIIQII
ncbi:unnamed protein product [Bursaphelenchus xylophilus]|uniref:(pine wood nematode) hypothetical protein n=1 Tax=Bursaphelenchus xylophilus TaxID=6326 RepID=A0A1I7RRG3_BURXY|nr:unnamed protein product [Bursaphelenchus xylophilus]CAG9131018.1 unnamed protein product [Bursaphelenchus xylophilus]